MIGDCCEDDCELLAVAIPGPPGKNGLPGDAAPVLNESPVGLRNGVNLVFTLAYVAQPGSVAVYRNGLREYLGIGYTVSGAVLTFTTAPLADDILTVDYLIGS